MFYYTTSGQTFTSKVKALEYTAVTGERLYYYYHDDKYLKLNWSVEPPGTLAHHYKTQAERLRNKYEYLILAYSGGWDSTNILETFHYNGIKLDKILIVGAFGQDSHSGVDENQNGELYANAFPYLEHLGLTSITEKYDYTQFFDTVENFSIAKYDENWVDTVGAWFSPHHWFWRDVEKHVIPKNIGSKKVGLIFGKDKPSLHNNSFSFVDTPLNSYGNISGTDNCDRINFYWDPEYPEILLKQLHILKRAAQMTQAQGHRSVYDEYTGAQVLGQKLSVNNIIYDLKRPLIYKSPKSKQNIISIRDRYLINKTESEIFKHFTRGVQQIDKRVGLKKMIPITTRSYAI